MKYLFYTLIYLAFFASCKSNNKALAIDSTIQTKPTSNQSEAIIAKFKPFIQGIWVKKDYIDKITKTKSPLAAMDEADDIITMDINTNSIKGDSLIVLHGNTHEGSQFTLKFNPGKTPNAITFDNNILRYAIENGDTLLYFTRPGDQNKKLMTTKYIRASIKNPINDLGFGINYFINKTLATGTYLLKDSTGSLSKVTFTNDGQVSGFMNHKKYEINFDLNSDLMDNLDEIGFDIRTKYPASFSFKIDGDTLNFYNTHPNADSTKSVLGKLAYKLVKQK
jgi:hypothetical protein